jgi:hypothetical protein
LLGQFNETISLGLSLQVLISFLLYEVVIPVQHLTPIMNLSSRISMLAAYPAAHCLTIKA